MSLEAGSWLGPYQVVGLLGSGGMGEVYRARDPRLDREVAIKVLPDGVADRKHLRRFEQEARAAGALNHPSVLAVYDVGTHEGVPYVVSELLQGHTLRARLEGGALPVRKALDLASQIARGLAAAHDKGIVHRDLKPDNVFVTEDGRVKILDFGLAKLTRPEPLLQEGHRRPAADGTESGTVIGTAGYMSPEQIRGEVVDHRSDIFSFGAVLFETLSGVRAFRRDSAVETMNAILKEDPPELSGPGRAISPGVASIVRRCLEKRASDRFHSAHDLALALEAASSGASGPYEERRGVARKVRLSKRHKRWMALAAMVLLAGGLYWGLDRAPSPPVAGVVDSVAVLPFENVGGDPDREYLSDGIADTLIDELSRLPNLRVIARSTSFRFRGREVDPRKAGRDLGVEAVLTGRVSLRGDTLVIGAELVDVARGTRLWGERYSTSMRDVFAVQEDISRDISRGLRLKLASRDETFPTRRHAPNPEAYRLYLLSRHELNKLPTLQGVKRALEYAEQAIEKDPAYAPAYATLAGAYTSLGVGSVLPPREAFSKAKAGAMKALEIDETLAEAHVAHATAVLYLDRDWARAESGFKRALDINPNLLPAHHGYALYLDQVGRSPEAREHVKRAVELDPLSPRRHVALSLGYMFDRRFDLALEALRTAADLDPGSSPAWVLGLIYREKGMLEEAIAEFRKAGEEHPPNLALLGNAYARAGRVSEARGCLRKLMEMFRRDSVGTFGIAVVHAGLGEKDQAFEWLEKAYEERDQGMMLMKIDPALDPLRSDPRFQDLVRRMNFPS